MQFIHCVCICLVFENFDPLSIESYLHVDISMKFFNLEARENQQSVFQFETSVCVFCGKLLALIYLNLFAFHIIGKNLSETDNQYSLNIGDE